MTARLAYVTVSAAVIALGLLARWPGLGLPFWLSKYAGSTLWGAMVYLIVSAVFPLRGWTVRAAIAVAIAASVEFSRLYHTPALDAFRLTLAGALLLGRIFSPWNIVAYVASIVAAILVERCVLGTGRPAL